MAKVSDLPTHQERVDATADARRAARYKYAEARIRKIVDGAPPFTAEQRHKLATLLRSA
jgi:hypothetical protein